MTTLTLVLDPATATPPPPLGPSANRHSYPDNSHPDNSHPDKSHRRGGEERATQLVGVLAHRALEVLQLRRQAKHVQALFGDESMTVLRAWSGVPAWEGARIGSVRATVLSHRHVEGCVRVVTGGRSVMITLRLERSPRGWTCARIDVLCSRGHLERWGVAAA
jgi:hypothetical protein